MLARHLPAFGFQRERWRNGAGWTREILRWPPPDADGAAAAGAPDAPDARRAPADIPIDANAAARSGPDPAAAIAFHWRASLADIEQDCAFSTFPGCDRQLVLVSGEGALLHCADGSTLPLQPPHGRAGFSGDESVHCTVQGRVVVFNLIAARDRVQAQLLHRPLVGPMVFFPEPGVQWLLLLLGGRASLPDSPNRLLLEQGDALLLQPEPRNPHRAVLSGGGELLLARLSPP